MRVLILFSQPWKTGGAETHVEALIKGLAAHAVFLTVNQGSSPEKLESLRGTYPHLRIYEIQARGCNVLRWKRDLDRLKSLLQEERIEVVSAQQRTAGLWAWYLWKKTGVPFTVTMHDAWHRAKFTSVYSRLFPKMLVVSQNLADRLQTDFTFSAQQITVIDNGIDFDAFTPRSMAEARAELGLRSDEKIVLHVSRLSRIKGAVSLKIIESMESLLKQKIADRLIIIGEGPMQDAIAQSIRQFNQKWGPHIELRGFNDRILSWYNAADFLIGEGRVAIETLACRKPVIAIRNAERFIGAIIPQNIAYACDVNFDGKDLAVTPQNMAMAAQQAVLLSEQEKEQIEVYIKNRLSVAKMTESYREVFRQL